MCSTIFFLLYSLSFHFHFGGVCVFTLKFFYSGEFWTYKKVDKCSKPQCTHPPDSPTFNPWLILSLPPSCFLYLLGYFETNHRHDIFSCINISVCTLKGPVPCLDVLFTSLGLYPHLWICFWAFSLVPSVCLSTPVPILHCLNYHGFILSL